MKKTFKITAQERDIIAVLYSKGLSGRQIAKKLGRHHTSISREIKRNSFKGKYYVAIHAQAQTRRRVVKARKRPTLKNPQVYRWAISRLLRGWSPEQIVGRMKLIFPQNPSMRISPETIYQFIYSKGQAHRKWWEYLPRKQKKRKKQAGRSVHKSRIPNRVSIHQRPIKVDQREVFGHWEGDSVIGKRGGKAIHTTVERKTRILKAKLVGSMESPARILAQLSLFVSLPTKARRSTTLDNGKEFINHAVLRNVLDMKTYHCDPYSSWQRGTNENTNGLLRRYLPKGTNFDSLTQRELDEIVEEINNRPRKCLKYYTPNEVFKKELGGAIQTRM